MGYCTRQYGRSKSINLAIAFAIVTITLGITFAIVRTCQPTYFELTRYLKLKLGGCVNEQLLGDSKDVIGAANESLNVRKQSNADYDPMRASLDANEVATEFEDINIGHQYFLSKRLSNNSFNAPLYSNRPKFGRLGDLKGELSEKQIFTAVSKYKTFTGFKWLQVEINNQNGQQVNAWLPWGRYETPVVKVSQ